MLLKEVCMAKGWFLFFFFLNFKDIPPGSIALSAYCLTQRSICSKVQICIR